jgi:hypothetical protein
VPASAEHVRARGDRANPRPSREYERASSGCSERAAAVAGPLLPRAHAEPARAMLSPQPTSLIAATSSGARCSLAARRPSRRRPSRAHATARCPSPSARRVSHLPASDRPAPDGTIAFCIRCTCCFRTFSLPTFIVMMVSQAVCKLQPIQEGQRDLGHCSPLVAIGQLLHPATPACVISGVHISRGALIFRHGRLRFTDLPDFVT